MGFACAQVVIDALNRAGATSPADMTALREAVRVAGTATDVTYKTSSAISRSTRTATRARRSSRSTRSTLPAPNGKGDWKFETQVDYAQVVDRSKRPGIRRIPGL